ncbi:hypothetical protein [Streptomyces adustus]|uniref:hypothetical protein n=1 Tax=Streptomyces adustus TaxID=1609272 RepID=UPI003718DD80
MPMDPSPSNAPSTCNYPATRTYTQPKRNPALVIDLETGIRSLKPHRAEGQRPSAKRLEQEAKARMPERTLTGIVTRTAYWVERWRRSGRAAAVRDVIPVPG